MKTEKKHKFFCWLFILLILNKIPKNTRVWVTKARTNKVKEELRSIRNIYQFSTLNLFTKFIMIMLRVTYNISTMYVCVSKKKYLTHWSLEHVVSDPGGWSGSDLWEKPDPVPYLGKKINSTTLTTQPGSGSCLVFTW